MLDPDGKQYGVECQTWLHNESINGNGGLESFALLKKFQKGWKNLMSITLNPTGRYVGEFKQYGNQAIGNQSVYGESGERCADLFFSFMEHNFSNIGKYSNQIKNVSIPKTLDLGRNGLPTHNGGAANGLGYLMKQHTHRFLQYTHNVPDVMMYMEDIITQVLGEDFFASQKSVSEIFESSPEEFFIELPTLYKIKKEELLEFLQGINVFDYFKNKDIRPYIIKSLPFLINFIDPSNFTELLAKTGVRELFAGGTGVFIELAKMMTSKSGETKKLFFNFIDSKFSDIVNTLGGSGVGLGKLINLLKRPKLDVHKDAKVNVDTGNFEIEREDNRGNKTKKTIADENLIFSSKEIKMLLDKHKDEIKSYFSNHGQNPDIEYMRFLIQHLPEGQSKGQLNAMKEEFVDYYNAKFDKGTSDFPGKMLYDGLMNQLRFKLGEKPKRKSFDLFGIWKFKSNVDYPFTNDSLRIQDMAIQDMSDSKYLVYLLKYFYKNLKEKYGKLEYSPEGRPRFINTKKHEVTQSLSDFLYLTAALNGIGKNEIQSWMNKINSNFIKMGEAERDPNKYKIPAPSPGIVDWADNESLYAEKEQKLDEVAFKSYIRNKIIGQWEK